MYITYNDITLFCCLRKKKILQEGKSSSDALPILRVEITQFNYPTNERDSESAMTKHSYWSPLVAGAVKHSSTNVSFNYTLTLPMLKQL